MGAEDALKTMECIPKPSAGSGQRHFLSGRFVGKTITVTGPSGPEDLVPTVLKAVLRLRVLHHMKRFCSPLHVKTRRD